MIVYRGVNKRVDFTDNFYALIKESRIDWSRLFIYSRERIASGQC